MCIFTQKGPAHREPGCSTTVLSKLNFLLLSRRALPLQPSALGSGVISACRAAAAGATSPCSAAEE